MAYRFLALSELSASTQLQHGSKPASRRRGVQCRNTSGRPAACHRLPEGAHLCGDKLEAPQLAALKDFGVTKITHIKSPFNVMASEGGETYVLAHGRRYVFPTYTSQDFPSHETSIDLSGDQPVVHMSDIPEDARAASRAVKTVNSMLWDVKYELERQAKDRAYLQSGKF